MIQSPYLRAALIAVSLTAIGGCMDEQLGGAKHLRPLSYATVRELEDKGMRKEDPIVVRIYKEESTLEVWKPGKDGRYAFFKTYEICKWSGKLGPKIREGDKQAPEGFYTVTPAQMNPNSSYYLSFNIGFPNAYDQSHGRTGRHLMVHGACSSAGCYSMNDEQIAEIYALARDAFRGGQRDFQVQAYPFRMTPANMARHAGDPNMAFWKKLKEGSDHFEVTGKPPVVGVCNRDYVFNATPADPRQRLMANARCPQLEVPDTIRVAVASKQMRDETAYQVALAEIKLQEKLQQKAPAGPDVVMTASIAEEGSEAGYATESEADKVLGGQVVAAAAPVPAKVEPAAFETVAADIGGAEIPPVATAFSGVWGKLVGITGLRSLGNLKGNEQTAAPAATGPEEGDPITTGSVPLPAQRPSGKSAAADSLPDLNPATAFVPVLINDDPFAIFDFFEEVDGVSVPADIVRR